MTRCDADECVDVLPLKMIQREKLGSMTQTRNALLFGASGAAACTACALGDRLIPALLAIVRLPHFRLPMPEHPFGQSNPTRKIR